MKILLLTLVVLVALVALFALVGALLPRDHIATRTATFRQTPHALFVAVRDFAASPAWREELKSVQMLPAENGLTRFVEVSRHGAVPYVVRRERPDELLVTEISDGRLPFGGTWTFEFTRETDGTSVRITEHGFVKPPLFRFLARFAFGYHRTMENYLKALGRKFGEDVTPRP